MSNPVLPCNTHCKSMRLHPNVGQSSSPHKLMDTKMLEGSRLSSLREVRSDGNLLRFTQLCSGRKVGWKSSWFFKRRQVSGCLWKTSQLFNVGSSFNNFKGGAYRMKCFCGQPLASGQPTVRHWVYLNLWRTAHLDGGEVLTLSCCLPPHPEALQHHCPRNGVIIDLSFLEGKDGVHSV